MISDSNKLIHKGQKLIKIVDRYKDVWQVVEEYQSDELASILEDEKKLKKAKEAGDRKRKTGQESKRVEDKRQKTFHAPTDHCCSGRRWAFVINPLSVSVQPSGEKRLILDLRHMNECLIKCRFRYEGWRVKVTYFEKDAYMFSFDLKSGYHHIEIASEHETLWGFS